MKTVPTSGTFHLGILTQDIQKTVAFYEMLGFVVVNRSDSGDLFFLERGNLQIETFISANVHPTDGAIDHLALDTEDVDGAFEIIRNGGYELLTPQVYELVMCHHPIRFFKFRGPNREIIELIQTFPEYVE